MLSKMVTDRRRSARFVEVAALTHAEEAAAALAPLLEAELAEGETLPDLALLQRLLGRALATQSAAMVAADELHNAELDDDFAPRSRRDEVTAELYRRLVGIRGAAAELYGAERSAALLGVDGATAQQPDALRRQAERLMARLRDPAFELPPPLLPGVAVDPASWVEILEPAATAVGEVLRELDRETREAETSFKNKTAAMAAYDRVFLSVARLLEALYRSAGEELLADRVRPSGRRPGETAEPPPVEGEEAAGGAEPAGDGDNAGDESAETGPDAVRAAGGGPRTPTD